MGCHRETEAAAYHSALAPARTTVACGASAAVTVDPRRPHYLCLDAPGGGQARVVFDGSLDGVPQRWVARLRTLQHCYQELGQDVPWGTAPVALRQYLEVGEPEEAGRRLEVGLMVPAIDGPTIAKTIIMVRQYRRLRLGRHEFGPAYVFPQGDQSGS